jgi:5-deoxy-glucuronate isomerase
MTPKQLASCLRSAPKGRLSPRYRALVTEGRGTKAGGFDARMDFGILCLRRGETLRTTTTKESLWVLLQGRCQVTVAGTVARVARHSLFDEGPTAVHAGLGEAIEFRAKTRCEWALTRTTNPRRIGARLYRNTEFATEDRGAGLAQGACRRLVRTIFDYHSRPEAKLVAGEVVNYPGRWSTYPPHHHPQPEIYHYRFTLPQGYGHAEIGDRVYKVRSGDTALIPGGLDHAQVSAPGYGMYYLWVIRHLPNRPYRRFTFTPEHTWLLDPKRQGWMPPVST